VLEPANAKDTCAVLTLSRLSACSEAAAGRVDGA
jgi:hypothetical protein